MNQTLRFAAFPLPAPPEELAQTCPTVRDGHVPRRRSGRLARGTHADPPPLEGAVLGDRYEVGASIGVGGWEDMFEGPVLDSAEVLCAAGSGVQLETARAGDYSATSVGPLDRFWHTNEVFTTTGQFQWATFVCEFEVGTGTGNSPPTASGTMMTAEPVTSRSSSKLPSSG